MAALQQLESLDRSIVTHTALCAEHIATYVPPVVAGHARQRGRRPVPRQSRSLDAAVVQEGRPLGVVRREQLFDLLAKPLHPEIYNKKPVTSVMESPTLLIDGQLRLEQVSRLVTQKGRPRLTEEFVITKDGRYHGLGQTIDVLRLITEQQLQSAKHSNPLTLLPGNAARAQLHRSPDRESQALRRRVFRPGFVQALQRRVRLRAGRPGDPAPGGPAEEHVLGAARFRRRTSAATTSSW